MKARQVNVKHKSKRHLEESQLLEHSTPLTCLQHDAQLPVAQDSRCRASQSRQHYKYPPQSYGTIYQHPLIDTSNKHQPKQNAQYVLINKLNKLLNLHQFTPSIV